MANELRFRADLEDKVSAGLGRIGAAFDRVGGPGSAASLFGNIGAKAVASGFGLIDSAASAVVGVLGDARQAFQDDQKSQEQLQASLKANVAGYNGNKDAIEAVLLARERLGFSDDEQRASLSTLLVRTHDSAKALDLQRTAMDLARLKGIDLATASDLVGKAYGGQVGALKKAGIAVDAHATAAEALAAVEKAVAGQAEAYADTSAGKEAAANLKVGEAMENLGATIDRVATAVLPGLADAMSAVVDAIATVIDAVEGFIGGIGDAAKAVNDFVGSIPGPWHQATDQISQDALDTSKRMLELGKTPQAIADDMRESRAIAGAASQVITAPIVKATKDAHDGAVAIAHKTPGDIADGIRSSRSALTAMANQLAEDLKHPLSAAAERLQIIGELGGKKLAAGLRSKDPLIRAEAKAYQLSLMDRLRDIDSHKWGENAGKAYASGLRSSYGNVVAAANRLANAVSQRIHTRSPAEAGPLSKDGGPEGWGEHLALSFGRGLSRGMPDVGGLLGSAITGPPAVAAARAAAGAPGGSDWTLVPVRTRDLTDAVDRELYYRLQRAAPTLARP